MREALDDSGRHAGLLLDRFRRVVRQARGPAGDERTGARSGALRRELLAQDDVSDAQRQHAFHSRPARNPFVGVGAGLRHARFDLHEFCAASGAALAHLAVTDRLRNRRVPGAEEIGAEGDHIVGAGEIERGQRGVAEAQQICLAQHSFVEGLVPDRRRRAVGFQEALDQFVALSAQGPREKGQSVGGLRRLQARTGARTVPSAHRPSLFPGTRRSRARRCA